MFATVKDQVDIIDVAEKLFSTEYRAIGESTFEPEDKECPFCNHRDCFRIKKTEKESFYKCFSCDETGDVIALTAKVKAITPVEAVKLLSTEYDVVLPKDHNPVQGIFNQAAVYYHNILLETGPCPELNGLTPLEFQHDRRKHLPKVLGDMQVGWSDGGLVPHLVSLGYDEELIKASGLVNRRGKDFLPSKVFIYPHKVKSHTSHFTFKDPLKQLEYQLPNKNKLRGHCFYNSDSITLNGPVIVVEGENDLISTIEAGWESGVIATIGSVSSTQLDWLRVNLANREVITLFDPDPAGDGYRTKVNKLKTSFSSLRQVRLDGKDIDEYLKGGATLESALAVTSCPDYGISDSDYSQEQASESNTVNGIVEKDGAYYKIRYKDGEPTLVKITNFTMKLMNIFIRDGQRQREMILTKDNGYVSEPLIIPSEAKVSTKLFKTLVANAADASYYGKEEDLTSLWEYVYSQGTERVVHIPEIIGRHEALKGWLFKDYFINDLGVKYVADETGVIWTDEKHGLKPVSVDSSTAHDVDGEFLSNKVLTLYDRLTVQESEDLLEGFIRQLSLNLNRNGTMLGEALTSVGFCWSSVYSNLLFSRIGDGFPFLMLWGDKDRGKSTVLSWLLSLFGPPEARLITVPNMNSGVGWGRKMAYFSSLPACIDELRANKESVEIYGKMRGYYNRISRTIGAKESFATSSQKVRSTLILGGQDTISDDATRQRCIIVRVPKEGREKITSYEWITSRKDILSGIGYHWIANAHRLDAETIVKGTKDLNHAMQSLGVPSRTAINWCIPGYFANLLAKTYFPEYDYLGYMRQASLNETLNMEEGDMVIRFFEMLEGLQVGDRPPISPDHIRQEGDFLYLWFSEIFRIVNKEKRNDTEEVFSKQAIYNSIRESKYFVEETRKSMGMNGTIRRVLKLNLTEAPEALQSIGSFIRN